ncbi:MAG: threonylcarbamoyl-AMP synthase, partial [Defluviitaleaceae bacterium]|nr:threonylcarbamoyl-AMP synthase [Defluviitaleaceae bacterium]
MKYRHYAPQAKLTLVMGKMDAVVYMINKLTENKSKEKTAVIATSQTIHRYPNRQTLNLGDRENPESICANLFRILRTCDEMGLEEIFAEGLEENGLGAAIMNRLKKASGYNIIRLNH